MAIDKARGHIYMSDQSVNFIVVYDTAGNLLKVIE
jgi:hypothetical protein